MPTRGPDPLDASLSRRRLLGLGAAAVASTMLPVPAAGAAARRAGPRWQAGGSADRLQPSIRPRSDWAGDLGVKGELRAEDDVRFLLVHHTASTNSYTAAEVAEQIRGFYEFHTGPDKGWPDVAYNFFIDRFGGIWEGRQGSLAGPVMGDATGGSQGFAVLCSLIGNHQEEPLTAEQQSSLVSLLAWLGETYQVDTTPGASVSFVSRGSNRWPAGTEVTTGTIAGHRDMSLTSCPGDFAYALVATELPTMVTELRASAVGPAPEPQDSTSTTGELALPEPSETGSPDSPSATLGSSAGETTGSQVDPGTAVAELADQAGDGGSSRSWPMVVVGGFAAVAAAGTAFVSRLKGQLGRGPG